MSIVDSFILLSGIPYYGPIIFCSCIHLLMNILVAFKFHLLPKWLLWTFQILYTHSFYFSLNNMLNMSSRFLNIYNLIEVTAYVFWSSNSIIGIFLWPFQLINFVLNMSYNFWFFAYPEFFFIGARYLNFTLLDVVYFYILDLCSEMWLSNLETVWSIQVCFFMLFLKRPVQHFI